MEYAMWILAGGILGWLGFTYWGFNEERGAKVASVIGMAGGFLGGKLAPMFIEAPAAAGFSIATLVFAGAVAAACLAIANLVNARWGV